MANWYEPTQQDRDRWESWLEGRPECVRHTAARFPPWKLFLLKPTGQRVHSRAFSEDGTMRVVVDPAYNCVVFAREVFGIDPNDLEECDLPDQGAPVGSFETGFRAFGEPDGASN